MINMAYAFADRSDLAQIKQLLTVCGLPSEDIDRHLDHFIVGKDGNELAGVIGLEPLGETGLLRSLAVAEPQRGKGVGKALYSRLLGYAHMKGIKSLYLLTLTAKEYFLKLGFAPIERGTVPEDVRTTLEFQSLCPETAVCMAKNLRNDVHYYPREILRFQPDVPGASQWGVALDKAMLTYFEVQPHSRFDRHSHESEQITLVLLGELFFEVDDRTICVREGEVIAIPANAVHAVFTREHPARAVDAWSPVMSKYTEREA
jgi:amino-acid N-acetyltransferase